MPDDLPNWSGSNPNIRRMYKNIISRYLRVLPDRIAKEQAVWEVNARISIAYSSGLTTYQEIADKIGISKERVRQRIIFHKRRKKSPIERYFNQAILVDLDD